MAARGDHLVVSAKRALAERVVALELRHPDGARLPDWAPGAHIDVILPGGHVRQYSLCGDRWQPDVYRIAVLREGEGRGGSVAVHDLLEVGDLVGYGGPRNNFRLVPAQEYLFVAGGIGITPLLPMIDQAVRLDAEWTLLYGGRRRATMALLDEISALDADAGRVELYPSDAGGRLAVAERVGPHRPGRVVYACGPTRLLEELRTHCAHWPVGTLRTERFVADDVATGADEPFDVELASTGRLVRVDPGVSVLDALRNAGVSVLSSCARGLCGTCEVAVLKGSPDHRDSLLDDAERRAGTSMFVCVSRAHGDRLLLDL